MRAYEIGAQEGLESLRVSERAELTPGVGEAVIRVKAVCLNHRDMLVLQGTYGARRPQERIPTSDGVGEVISIGPGVRGIAVGDRVACTHFIRWIDGAFDPSMFADDLGVSRDGWLAEQICVPAEALVKVPEELSDTQAAALPAAGVTAWNAVVEVGKVRAGDVVLTLGTGGVSILALQIAKLHGATVVITSSSDEKLAIARTLGADVGVNYAATPDWPAAVLAATGGRGADIVVETGGFTTLGQSISAAAPNARVVLIGALGGPPTQGLSNFSSIIGKNLTLKGVTEGSRRMLFELMRAFAGAGVTPIIDKVFPFDQAAEAYQHLKSRRHLGKVMIRL